MNANIREKLVEFLVSAAACMLRSLGLDEKDVTHAQGEIREALEGKGGAR